jgi:hypothetical protein
MAACPYSGWFSASLACASLTSTGGVAATGFQQRGNLCSADCSGEQRHWQHSSSTSRQRPSVTTMLSAGPPPFICFPTSCPSSASVSNGSQNRSLTPGHTNSPCGMRTRRAQRSRSGPASRRSESDWATARRSAPRAVAGRPAQGGGRRLRTAAPAPHSSARSTPQPAIARQPPPAAPAPDPPAAARPRSPTSAPRRSARTQARPRRAARTRRREQPLPGGSLTLGPGDVRGCRASPSPARRSPAPPASWRRTRRVGLRGDRRSGDRAARRDRAARPRRSSGDSHAVRRHTA